MDPQKWKGELKTNNVVLSGRSVIGFSFGPILTPGQNNTYVKLKNSVYFLKAKKIFKDF